MKRLVFLIFLVNSIIGYSQELLSLGKIYRNLDLEDSGEYKYISIDTNQIWQITKPNKQILYMPPTVPGEKAIITDTNMYYGSNIKASFQFKLYSGEGDAYSIRFDHKYDFENNKDGGIIETSYDDGNSWQNILFDTIIQNNIINKANLYGLTDTISSFNNQPGFTGLQSNMVRVVIDYWPNESIRGDTMLLRFTISTDTVDMQNEGWMLDFFTLGGWEENVINESTNQRQIINIYPNPAESLLLIKSKEKNIIKIEIISMAGEVIYGKEGYDIRAVDIAGLIPGIYLVIIKDKDNNYQVSKLCKVSKDYNY